MRKYKFIDTDNIVSEEDIKEMYDSIDEEYLEGIECFEDFLTELEFDETIKLVVA